MEPKKPSALIRFFDGVLDATCWIAGVIIVFVMLAVVYDVLARKLFGKPTTWVLDTSTLSLLIAAMLPAAWVLERKAHVNIELVTSKLSEKSRTLLNMITYSLALLGCGVVVWQGIDVTYAAYRDNEMLFRSLVFPKVWYIWVFALTFFLLMIQLAREIAVFYSNLRGRGH